MITKIKTPVIVQTKHKLHDKIVKVLCHVV